MELKAPSGEVISFPEGTDPTVAQAYMEKYHQPEPNVAERVVGHLSKGMGQVLQKVSNVGSYLTGETPTPGPYQRFFEENPFASAVTAYPETSLLGQAAGGLVEFLPQVPIYTIGGRAVLGAMSKLPIVGEAAGSLLTPAATTMGRYAKAIGRGAAEGGIVGTIAGTPSTTPFEKKMEEGAKEALGFGAAAAVFHPVFSILGAAGKGIVRRLRSKATPDNVEAELAKKAKTDPAAAEDLRKLQEARMAEQPPEQLYVPKGTEEPIATSMGKQGELSLEPIGEEQMARFRELGYTEADLTGKSDKELIDILEKGTPASINFSHAFSNMSKSISDNFYIMMYDTITGKVNTGKIDTFYRKAKEAFDLGIIKGPTDLRILYEKGISNDKELIDILENGIQSTNIKKDNIVQFKPTTKENIIEASSKLSQYLTGTEMDIKPENVTYKERVPDPEDTSIFANKMKSIIRKLLDDFHERPRGIGEGTNPFTGNPTTDVRVGYGTGHERIVSNRGVTISREGVGEPTVEHVAFFPKYVVQVYDKVEGKWITLEECYNDAETIAWYNRIKQVMIGGKSDKTNIQGIQGGERGGKESLVGRPESGTGKETPPAGGVVQASEGAGKTPIQKRTEARLEKLGYSAEEIATMKPSEQISILKEKRVKGGEPAPSVQPMNKLSGGEIYMLQRMGYQGKEIREMKPEEARAAIDRVRSAPDPSPEELEKAEAAAKQIEENARQREARTDEEKRVIPELTEEERAQLEADIEKELASTDEEGSISRVAELIIKMQNRMNDPTLDTLVENMPKSKEEIALDWKIALERRNMEIEAKRVAEQTGKAISSTEAKPTAPKTRKELDALLRNVRGKARREKTSVEDIQKKYEDILAKEGMGELSESGRDELNFDDSRLNMMIPLDQAPAIVKGLLKDIKATVGDVLHRNREIFKKTGYWLGKDGKWRYEIDDRKLEVRPTIIDTSMLSGTTIRRINSGENKGWYQIIKPDGTSFISRANQFLRDLYGSQKNIHILPDVIDHPTLYDAVPELKDVKIVVDPNIKSDGEYNAVERLITVKNSDKDTIIHEIQHTVNDIVGSKFRGTSPNEQEMAGRIQLFTRLRNIVKDQDLKRELTDLIYTSSRLLSKSVHDLTYDMRRKAITKSPDDFVSIEEALNSYLEETPFYLYMKNPGEMEARLSERRMNMSSDERGSVPPWDTLDDMLIEEGLIYDFPAPTGNEPIGSKLYSGIDPTQIINFTKKLLGEKKTVANADSKRVISEINGKQFTIKDDADFVDGWLRQMGQNISRFVQTKLESPDFAYRNNERVNPLIFNMHKRFFEGNFSASKRNETVRAAEALLPDLASKEKIKDLLEGKTTEGTPEELEAARMLRSELDAVRDKYKEHLRQEYKNNLNEDENAALADILAGMPVEEAIAKYKTRIVPDKLGRRRVRKWIDEDVVRDIAKEYSEIDKWGLDDYMSHYEKGPLRIVSGGKLYAKAVSEQDAARKFADLVELYPDKEFQLDTKHNLEELAAGLSKRSYNRLLFNLQEGLKQTIEGINSSAARRLAQKGMQGRFFIKPTQQFSPYTMDRKDFLQGEKNVFDILYNYMYSMEKKMALDPAIDDVRKAISRVDVVGQEAYTASDGTQKMRDIKRPYLTEDESKYLIRYIEDIKGKLYKGDELVDAIFKNAGSQRLYSKAIQMSREVEANLKLGYAPVKGLINAASGLGHIWTKTGVKYISEGVDFLKTAEGEQFMKAMEPYLGVNIVESATGELTTRGTFEKWGWLAPPKTEAGRALHTAIEPLGLFQASEAPVRKLTLAANYLMAKDSGLGEAAARDAAIKANWFQQFTYDMASLPELMRGPTGRLITQFKPYLLKELEFISTLRGPEIARYMGMQVALGGPRGLVLIAKSLPIIGMMQGWNELENWMNKEYPRLSRGIGGVLGVDVSAPATFQFPSSMKDWLGPTLSDISALYKDLVVPLVDGHGPAGVEGMKAATTVFPILRHWRNMIEQVIDKDGWVKDERGRRLWNIDNMATFVAKSTAGAEPIELNRIRVAERNLNEENKLLSDQKKETIDDVLDSVAKGQPLSQGLIERMTKLGIQPGTLRRAAQFRVLDPKMRRLLMTELVRRPEILELYPEAGDLQ